VDSDPDTLVAVRRKDVDLDTKEGREMAMLDNLTTQVNLAWDKTEIESISDQVEGFDVGDFGFEIDDLPQVVMPTDKNAGEDVNPDDYGDEFNLPNGGKSPYVRYGFMLAQAQLEAVENALKMAKNDPSFEYTERFGNENENGNALYHIIKQWEEQRKSSSK